MDKMDERVLREEEYEVSLEDLKKESDEIAKKLKEPNKTIEERLKDLPEDFFQNSIDLDNGNSIDIPEESEDENSEQKEDENEEDISDEQFDYTMMELMYLKRFDRQPEDDNSDLYPTDWYKDPDYQKQFEILSEAVAENKRISETKGYSELRKGKNIR